MFHFAKEVLDVSRKAIESRDLSMTQNKQGYDRASERSCYAEAR